jgi:hypothetical protein
MLHMYQGKWESALIDHWSSSPYAALLEDLEGRKTEGAPAS